MEPRHRAPGALSPLQPTPAVAADTRTVTRIRLLAVCLLLTGLAFVQDPGLIVPDTKVDLVLDPGRFLGRALNLWDPASAFGQLQNQAYGYLWPMGPFFWLGDALGVPGWAVQRGWWALLLCVAFLGAALVARALGVRRDLAVVVVGLAYALSPRLLTVTGPISIEGWPTALAPWVLLPLVIGADRGSPRRAAALSALAIAMVGGVNAAATFAVLPVAAVWLLTRQRGPRRRALLIWWPVFTLLGTVWWLVPLFTLGAYSPAFLDFIETSSITTYPTTVFDALRGTSNWVPYVSSSSRAGNDLITEGYLAVMSAVLVALGLVGLLDRRQPHRWFLSLSLLLGLVMVTAGHQGAVQGFFASGIAEGLDAALAPLRNVHKFDPVVRLPLVLGLGWAVQRLLDLRVRSRGEALDVAVVGRTDRIVALGVAGLALVLAASPALVTRLAPGGAFAEVPDYWHQAAAWLDDADRGTALLVPGSAFGDYIWGTPRDEPLQALTRADWAVRNQIPLTPPGNIRMLDRIEQAFAQGDGSAALTASLRRAGVRWLVVRNDLAPSDDVPDPVLVHQALARSPGLTPITSFGPDIGGGAHLYDGETRVVVNGGWQREYPAVEVWGVPPVAETERRPAATVVAGGPEDLYDLADLGLLDEAATVLAPDVPDGELDGVLAGAPVVLTDGLRERERGFASVHDGYSAVRTPGDVRRTGNPTADYLEPEQASWLTTSTLAGVRRLSASSSASDAGVSGGAERGRLPYAAVDGDPETQWSANPGVSGEDWWQVDLEESRRLSEVTLTGGADASAVQVVRVRTPSWTSEPVDLGPGEQATLDVAGDPTASVRVESVFDARGPLALAEVSVPGMEVDRRLELPELPAGWGTPDAVVLRADRDARTGCAEVSGAVRCTPVEVRDSEEQAGSARRFSLSEATTYAPELWVRPKPGPGLDALLASSQPVNVQASSSAVADPRGSAAAAVDGDPRTAWGAATEDLRPTLALSWLRPQRIDGIELTVSDDSPVARPTTVELRSESASREVTLSEDGTADFPPLRVSQLDVRVRAVAPAVDLDPGGSRGELPAGIGELRLSGAKLLPLLPSDRPALRACGTGPAVDVDGFLYETSVIASDVQLVQGARVPATLCGLTGGLELRAGSVDVTAQPSDEFAFDSMVLRRSAGAGGDAGGDSTGDSMGPPVDGGIFATRFNHNPGWEATQAGEPLEPLILDGWRQGWVTVGNEPVETGFAPDRTYRAGLVVGLLAWLGLVLGLGAVLTVPALRRRGRGDHPGPAGAWDPAPAWGVALGLVGAALLAGLPGLLLGVGVAGLSIWGQRRYPLVVTLALPTLVLVAAAAYLVRPWGELTGWAGDLAWPAYLALVPVVAAVVLGARGHDASRQRIEGRSTRR